MRVKSLFLLLFVGLCFMLLRTSYASEWASAMIGTPGEYSAFHQSMAMDDSGGLHIAYYQGWSHKKIRYATNKTGVWQTNSIDDNGRVTSVALDSKNNVHIIYFAKAAESGLKYATNSSGSWKITTVDPDVDVDFVYANSTAISIDSTDKVHVCYYMATKTPLKYASNVSGNWVSEIIDQDGYAGDISVDSADGIHVVYKNKSSQLMHATYASGNWNISDTSLSGQDPSITIDNLDSIHVAYISNDELYYALKSDAWESVKIDNQSSAPSLALDAHGNVHISYSGQTSANIWSTKYITNASGEWLAETVDPYEGLPDYFTDLYYRVAGFGGRNSIVIDSGGSAHITYQTWLDMTQNILKYATNKAPIYNISGEWKFSTTENWSVCEPDENSKRTLTIEQSGNYVKATNTDMAKNPVIFEGKSAGSIYELFTEFPEDNGYTFMMVSFMASSNSYGIGPQIWLYRESPSYCYGGCSIEYQRSSSGVSDNTGGSGGGGGGCFVATAAFGSPMETHVTILKNFRDTYLLPCSLGRIFVKTYNKYSPPVAHFIAKHETLKAAVRISLLPLVAVSYATFHFGPTVTLTTLVIFLIFAILLVSLYRRSVRSYRTSN